MRLPDQLLPRTTMREQELMKIIETLDAEAYAHGLQITLNTDFDELKRINKGLDKLPLTPNFDPDKADVNPTNGFWMKGVDFGGEVVFTQAARYYNCRNSTLALLHQSLKAFYEDPKAHAEDGEECVCEAPATHYISGHVCYHGELWLKKCYRGRGLTTTLPKLLMALVMLPWSPDYLFGMAQPGICTKGVGARYGYRNMQPHGMIWNVPSSGVLDEWVIWNNADDLEQAVMRN